MIYGIWYMFIGGNFDIKRSILIKPFGKKARREVLYVQIKKYIKLLALIVILLIVKEFDD